MPSVGGLLRELHIPWPAADEGSLREAARTWHHLAETIRDNYGMANSNATSLTSNNQGAAIDAFENYWRKFGGSKGALPLAANACDAMSTACSDYASAVAATKRKIEEAGAEVLAALVLGTIGAFFTFGASEGISDSVAAGLLARVVGLIDALGQEVGGLVAAAGWVVSDALETDLAQTVLARAVAGAAVGVGGTLSADAGRNAVRQLFGDEPLSQDELRKDLITAGLAGGAAGGVLGKLGEMGAEQLSKLLSNSAGTVAESNPQLFVDMMTLSGKLAGTTGKVSSGVLASVASQLITAQQVNAEDLSRDQLEGLLERLVGD